MAEVPMRETSRALISLFFFSLLFAKHSSKADAATENMVYNLKLTLRRLCQSVENNTSENIGGRGGTK